MPSSLKSNKMPTSLETLGSDVLLDVVQWLSRLDLLNLFIVVRALLFLSLPSMHI